MKFRNFFTERTQQLIVIVTDKDQITTKYDNNRKITMFPKDP